MEAMFFAPVMLHNAIAVVVALLITVVLRVRWLAALLSLASSIGASCLWRGIGQSWAIGWIRYLYKPVLGGGLWHGTVTHNEFVGLLLFWLLPLGLAYAVTLARVARIQKS